MQLLHLYIHYMHILAVCTDCILMHMHVTVVCIKSHGNSCLASLLNQHSAPSMFFFFRFQILLRMKINILTLVYLKINFPATLMLKINNPSQQNLPAPPLRIPTGLPGGLLVCCLSVCPSVRPSVCPSVTLRFSGLFSAVFWDIDLNFGIYICHDIIQIKSE